MVKKITIVGAGNVGSTTAYTLMISGLVSEIVIIDINRNKAEGEVMDLNHGMPFVSPTKIYFGDYSDCKDSDIIILTGGASQKPGETRIDLVNKNTAIFKTMVTEIIKYATSSIILVVTNPVDILTYVTYKISGFPKNKVIGSGTVLDSARFKYLISEQISVDARNVHAYIIGEHGDSEVPAWSLANIAGIPLDEYCRTIALKEHCIPREEIFYNVKNAAYQIIEKKGATYYAVGLAVKRIVESILRDENSILTVSSFVEGQFGLNQVCLSLPTVVNKNGIDRILEIPINENEQNLLIKSAESLKEIIKTLAI